ncbi:MAG: GyrI-like domain-containing protein [Candidatus Lokiarchaeota archaeon]|nr:GyrI-like domain-containing protein [Candidatus Lokiarchaeota archaeon]
MEETQPNIQYTIHPPQLVAFLRKSLKKRAEVLIELQKLSDAIPKDYVRGSPFCIFYFVTNIGDGFDVEIGIPIMEQFPSEFVKFRILPKLETFSIRHKGNLESIGQTYETVFTYAYQFGFPSQEFSREIYLDIEEEEKVEIEVQFIIHSWNSLLANHMVRVLGEKMQGKIMRGYQRFEIETPLQEKFEWLVRMLEKLEEVTNESQRFEILSGCAHFFPKELITEFKTVFDNARNSSTNLIDAVDKTLEYMKINPGGGSVPIRKGTRLYTTKNPRDPKAFQDAKTRIERMKAYCYCPIIRNNLDQKIPPFFCNCGAGWPKQIWEGIFDHPLRIEVIKSLTKGDDECEFCIYLPDE